MYARNYIGKPFDNGLMWGEDEIYCSELIYFSYKKASPERELFIPRPIEFIVNKEIWKKHFKGEMPKGRLGMFPQDIFESKYLDIIYNFFDTPVKSQLEPPKK